MRSKIVIYYSRSPSQSGYLSYLLVLSYNYSCYYYIRLYCGVNQYYTGGKGYRIYEILYEIYPEVPKTFII